MTTANSKPGIVQVERSDYIFFSPYVETPNCVKSKKVNKILPLCIPKKKRNHGIFLCMTDLQSNVSFHLPCS